MKKLIYILLLMPFMMNAQSLSDRIYQQYESQEGISSFSFSKSMLDAIDITTEDEKGNLHQITGDLSQIKFISQSYSEELNDDFFHSVQNLFENYKYEKVDVDSEQNQKEDVKVYVQRKGKYITEIHLLAKNIGEGSLVSFYGKLVTNELCAISTALSIDACEHLNKIR